MLFKTSFFLWICLTTVLNGVLKTLKPVEVSNDAKRGGTTDDKFIKDLC